ncbi:hypothetical protein Tco_1326295 [Tanacetum coccineum]
MYEPDLNVANDTVEIVLDETMVKDTVAGDAEIVSLGSIKIDKVMKDVSSGPESMPDDEIMSISGDDEEAESDKEFFSPNDDMVDDKLIDERIDDLVAHVKNMGNKIESSFPAQLELSLNSILPRLIVDALEECLPEILSETMKSQFPKLINDSIKENLSMLNKRMRLSLKTEMHDILEESPKIVNKQFHALNKLECNRFAQLEHQMHPIMYMEQMLHSTVKIPIDLLPGIVTAKNLTIMVNKTSADMNELVGLVSRILHFMESTPPPVNIGDVDHLNLYTKCNPTAPVLRGSHNSSTALLANTQLDGQTDSLTTIGDDQPNTLTNAILAPYYPIPPTKADNGKGIAKSSNDSTLKMIVLLQEAKRLAKAAKDKSEEALRRMTLAQRMAQKQKLTDIDTKRVQQLNKSYLMCIETRDDELPITKFRYQEMEKEDLTDEEEQTRIRNIWYEVEESDKYWEDYAMEFGHEEDISQFGDDTVKEADEQGMAEEMTHHKEDVADEKQHV